MGSVPARWASAGLTYDRPGATADDALPAGYNHLDVEAAIGRGPAAFERAVEGLLTWRMHRGAGLRLVAASAERAEAGVVVVLRAGPGPLSLPVPCRVVYTVDDPDRRGFGYGSLPGHPVRGEEAFLVHLDRHGRVHFRLRAFSRPATWVTRLGGPITTLAQQLAYDRYLASAHKLTQVHRT